MAILIPAIGSCVWRMTPGERRLAERLEQKLDSDYLLWYDVPVGPKYSHPDFVVMHPRHGLLNAARQEGHAWGGMAVICRHGWIRDECANALSRMRLPHQVRRASGSFSPNADTIKVLTMHARKGLEFPLVSLMGVGQMPEANEVEKDEARLFYVAATRSTSKPVITTSGTSKFGQTLLT